MTALAGLVTGPGQLLNQQSVRELIDAQSRYGSARVSLDSSGPATFAISPFGSGAASGPNPGVARAGSILLVADIRLDNREELRAIVGEVRPSISDSDLILALWSRLGSACLQRIIGDYAIALFDRATGTLFLARDPTGQRPLFYAHTRSFLAFASMPRALALLHGGSTLNRLHLAAIAAGVGDPCRDSCFKGVERVPPATLMELRLGAPARSATHWQPRIQARLSAGREDLVHEYRFQLQRAVAARIDGCPAPIASHLSGGYDSSAVTATAARLLSETGNLIAFTSAPRDGPLLVAQPRRFPDESQLAAETARLHGIRHIIVRSNSAIIDMMREQGRLLQMPVYSPFNMAWWVEIRRQAAAAGASCLLTGELGNLTLNAGGLYILSEWLRHGRWTKWWSEARAAASRPDMRWRGVLMNSFSPWMPTVAWEWLRRHYLDIRPTGSASFVRREWHDQVRSLAPLPDQPGTDPAEDRLHAIRHWDLGQHRKASLADAGIDERDPMSDRRLIEFSLNLPVESQFGNGVSRPLARAALSDRVPQSVLQLRGRGLQAADWASSLTRDEAGAALEEITTSSTAQELLDLGQMRAALEHWPSAGNDFASLQRYRIGWVSALAVGIFALDHEKPGLAPAASITPAGGNTSN